MTEKEFTSEYRRAHQAVYREVFVQSESAKLVVELMYEDNELGGLSPINERDYGEHNNIFEAMGLEYHKSNAQKVAKEIIKIMIESNSYILDGESVGSEDEWHWPQFKAQLKRREDGVALKLVEKAENGELAL